MLPVEIVTISDSHKLHVIDIVAIDSAMARLLDTSLVSICEGASDTELYIVKLKLKAFLDTKDLNTRMGAIAELLAHFYLRGCGYKQEFLFSNLEEGSIKKGFDGYFSKDDQSFIVESKSGQISTSGMSHRAKLQESYNDIKKYVSGKSDKSNNNPWRNAYNHACHLDVNTEKTSIIKQIKEISDLFDCGIFKKISEFNIIPCSTVYMNDNWSPIPSSTILQDNSFLNKFEGKTINSICITKCSVQQFLNYLVK
ncbi:hypothetical protein L4D00_02585 [Photobacterium swingsii]|uniref:hypothetical protein n=1 Tax=Photobacterium swingsii TaxID=680026 RepID=UPI003D0DC413